MKIADVTTFVIANPPPRFGGRYFIVVKITTDSGAANCMATATIKGILTR